jgi:hypothetical protein
MGWDQLQETYKSRGVVLALGAGLSLGCGLPTWVELLKRLGRVCLGDDYGDWLIDELRDKGSNLPAIASLLKACCPAHLSFTELLRDQLYRDFPKHLAKDRQELITYVQRQNPTMRAIASLCTIHDEQAGLYRRNSKIHAIINFNLDAVFRAYIRERYKTNFIRTIERASKRTFPERISIYYVHGFLRFDDKAQDTDEEAWDKLVFTEQEYFDFFNNPTSLFNYTFLHLLREYSCLFIGLSMQDDNIRRLLHYSRKERVQGYIEEGKNPQESVKRSLRHFAILPRFRMDQLNRVPNGLKHMSDRLKHTTDELNRTTERALQQLGTQVLWIDNFTEIPDRLKQMYESAGHKWESVY